MSIDKNTLLFHQLVLSFHTAAWQQLGKVANPFTNTIERDLESASMSIDMLDMIKTKMQGNLTDDEQKFLDRTLGDLKLNYMDELKKQEAEKLSAESSGDESAEDSESDEGEGGGENSEKTAGGE